MDYRASCAFSGPFWSQFEKATGNQVDAIFLKKIHFFLILISEFQFPRIFVDIMLKMWQNSSC